MTVTFHNGSAAHREHNIRKETVVAKQPHINRELSVNNLTLVDIPPRKAYKQIFGGALAAYNAKQKRADRRIPDYFNHVDNNPQMHTVYECILQIGHRDNHLPLKQEREILSRYFSGWAERNPNLFICGAYIHADEDGGTHLHIDYIPFSDSYKKGMTRQAGLVKAFEAQGIVGIDVRNTSQILWERRERQSLSELVAAQDVTVDETVGGRKHENTPEYKAKMAALAELDRQASVKKSELTKLDKALEVKTKQKATVDEISEIGERKTALIGAPYWRVEPADMKKLKTLAKKSVTADERVAEAESDHRIMLALYQPLRNRNDELTAENTGLKKEISNLNYAIQDLREERKRFIEVITAIQEFAKEFLPTFFERIDRIIDRTRRPENKKYVKKRQNHSHDFDMEL